MKQRTNITIALAISMALGAAGVVAPSDAAAQGQPPAAAQGGETLAARAARLYQEGNRAFEQKQWAEAEAAYLKAWAIVRSFDVAANLGEVEFRLNRPRLSARYLAFSLRTAPPSAKPAQLERSRHFFDEARKAVGAVRIKVSVPDAEVWVDEERIEPEDAGEEVFVNPGAHEVIALREGYEGARETIVAAPGSSQELTLTLRALPPPEPSGAKAPTGPQQGAGRGQGDAGGPRTAVLIAGGATAGAALVAGVILTVVANGKAAERDEQKDWERCYDASARSGLPDCASADDLGRDAAGFGNAAFWSFVGAGAIGGATAAYAILTSRSTDRLGRVTVVPLVAASGGGLGLTGRW